MSQGDIKLFNPNKEISKEITLEILIRHRDALKQARTGEKIGEREENQVGGNERKLNTSKSKKSGTATRKWLSLTESI